MARMPDAPLRQPPVLPPAAMPADAAAGLQDAISALRGALESRMDGLLWGGRQGPGREPAGAALFRSLLDAGFSTKLVRTLVERLPEGMTPEAALSWARNELVTHLPVLRSEDEFLAGGVYALVGPTGVGKTTTLAKLAARCVARDADHRQFPDRRAGTAADLRTPDGRARPLRARRGRVAPHPG
jgi:flagellar biosynthesis protein FlhF